jgi:hypothetical protein
MAENGRPLNFSFTKLQYLAIVNRQDETGARQSAIDRRLSTGPPEPTFETSVDLPVTFHVIRAVASGATLLPVLLRAYPHAEE